MLHPKLILAAVDFSTGSHAALQHAARLALLGGARLHVLHVVDAEALSTLAALREESFERHSQTAVAGAVTALDSWVKDMTLPAGWERTIAVGKPLHEILAHAERLHADLLVAGLAGQGGAASGAGAVAAKLARKAQAPTLLVRPGHAQPFRKIVACVDFSDTAQEVVRHAERMATLEGAQVDFLHVWREPWVVTPPGGLFAEGPEPALVFTESERQAYIENLRGSLRDFVSAHMRGGIAHTEVLREALSYAPGIQEHAAENNADLIIIGRQGRARLRHVLMGSTAERLLSRLPCSVLVIASQNSAGVEA